MVKFWTTLEYPKSLALLLSARTGHLELMKGILIFMPAEEILRTKDDRQRTALHLAAFYGQLETVQLLVERMPQEALMSKDELQLTPLHLAAIEGHLDIVQVLVNKMPPVALSSQDFNTALQRAQFHGRVRVADFLSSRMVAQAGTQDEPPKKVKKK